MTRVLLIEDDIWMAQCYKQWLAADNIVVAHALDAQSGLEVLDQYTPKAIVLDMALPYANGVQVLHALQSHHDLADIPVIVCSSTVPSDMPSLTQFGVVQVLHKATLHPRVFRHAVKQAINRAAV